MLRRFVFLFLLLSSVDSLAQTPPNSFGGAVQSMNPDTSVNFLTLYRAAKREGSTKTEPNGGLFLQEAELQFMANVDPYLRAVALFSVHPTETEPSTIGTGPIANLSEPQEKSYAIEPEEVYLETIAIPYVTLKAGRFHADLGRHNSLHTHAYPFIDAPLINQRLLGDEGVVENGLSASALMPLPWFMEVSAQALQGDSPALFASKSSTDFATVYRVRNLWDLADSATLDFGLSAAAGANFYDERTNVEGADLSIKWRPTQGGKYRSVAFAAEYLQGNVRGRPLDSELSGYATWVQIQLSERWWVQARTEQDESQDAGSKKHKKVSGLIGFYPSEFSGLRLQYDQLHDDEDRPLNSFMVQGNITIGAHPAHSY